MPSSPPIFWLILCLLPLVLVLTSVVPSQSDRFSRSAYGTLRGSLVHLYRTHGVRGYFQGFGATALRDAPYAGIYLALYEGCKGALTAVAAPGARPQPAGGSQQLAWVASASGVVAGATATLLTHPFDIIKTRIQTRVDAADAAAAAGSVRAPRATVRQQRPSLPSGQWSVAKYSTAHVPSSSAKPLGTLATARDILARDGLQAFVDGLGLRCARKALSSAIGWTIFEVGTKAVVNQHQTQQAVSTRGVAHAA